MLMGIPLYILLTAKVQLKKGNIKIDIMITDNQREKE